MDWIQQWQSKLNKQNGVAPLVRTGGSRHTGLAALPHRNIHIIDLKIRPYFEKKILSEITVADVRAWQNELLMYKDKNGKGYSQTYLKTINCQLTAIFNYAIRYYAFNCWE